MNQTEARQYEPQGTEALFILLRHGESLANAQGIYLGHTDWDLSERGYEQARRAAASLAERRIDEVYSSDLQRAFHTAAAHAQLRGIEVTSSRELREIYLGDWEGRLVTELDSEYPEEFGIGWRKKFGTCQPPNGEPVAQVARRLAGELKRIGERSLGKTILVGCHAAAIRSLWGLISGIEPADLADEIPFPRNVSITTVLYKDGGLVPLFYGDDEYLNG